MASNDFNTRVERTKDFLADGHRVKLVVKFVGRQITRKEFGVNLLEQAITALKDNGTPDQPPKWQGKLYIVQLKPSKQPKKEND
jgi:translation initiation factor IF-3